MIHERIYMLELMQFRLAESIEDANIHMHIDSFIRLSVMLIE